MILNAALANPTKRHVKDAEIAFYAYKNAMDLKLSEGEMESLVAALKELAAMEFDWATYGIKGNAY